MTELGLITYSALSWSSHLTLSGKNAGLFLSMLFCRPPPPSSCLCILEIS
jgi:hypothetical protein